MQAKRLIQLQKIEFFNNIPGPSKVLPKTRAYNQITVSNLNAHLAPDVDFLKRVAFAAGGDSILDITYDATGRPKHGADGLCCTCRSDNTKPMSILECPFWNDDDYRLPSGDRCCMLFHEDAPKGFSGLLLNDAVRQHFCDLQKKGIYLSRKIFEKGGGGGTGTGGRGRGRGRGRGT